LKFSWVHIFLDHPVFRFSCIYQVTALSVLFSVQHSERLNMSTPCFKIQFLAFSLVNK